MSSAERRKAYEEIFTPEDYRDKYETWAKKRTDNLYEDAFLPNLYLHNIFRDPNVRGVTMLDIGSGPTVHNLIPACFHYSDIVLSDLSLSNRKAAEKWLRNDPDALDWSAHITNAVKLCGYKDLEEGRRAVENLIRKKVKSVIPCDLLEKEIVPPEYQVPYDLVLARSVLECASPDYATFKEMIKKINRLVKVGGFFILSGYFMCSQYMCGCKPFPYLYITYDEVLKALKDAGFGDLQWQIKQSREDETEHNVDSSYCVRCTKLRECN